MSWKVGDIVHLKSGGPGMTISIVIGGNEALDKEYTEKGYSKSDVVCSWFSDEEELKTSPFRAETLVLVDEPSPF